MSDNKVIIRHGSRSPGKTIRLTLATLRDYIQASCAGSPKQRQAAKHTLVAVLITLGYKRHDARQLAQRFIAERRREITSAFVAQE